jgi:hypothetical protein
MVEPCRRSLSLNASTPSRVKSLRYRPAYARVRRPRGQCEGGSNQRAAITLWRGPPHRDCGNGKGPRSVFVPCSQTPPRQPRRCTYRLPLKHPPVILSLQAKLVGGQMGNDLRPLLIREPKLRVQPPSVLTNTLGNTWLIKS